MKITIYILFSLLLFSCNDDDNNDVDPVDQLPPATQTGANTFGCLIDGEVFIADGGGPFGGPNADGVTSYYQYVCDDGECFNYFQLSGENVDSFNSVSISMENDENMDISEGGEYELSDFDVENKAGRLLLNGLNEYLTNTTYTGNITFTRFDEENQIVSGTFEFEAVNENGETVNITDGRFDVDFTI